MSRQTKLTQHRIENILVDTSRTIADFAVQTVGESEQLFSEVVALVLRDEYPISMRASRVLQICTLNSPHLFEPYLYEFITKMSDFKVDGVKRGITKILSENNFYLPVELFEIIVDNCFKWLNSTNEPIAVKIYCLQILYNACKREPDLKHELICSIENQFINSSAGFKSVSKKIMKKLSLIM